MSCKHKNYSFQLCAFLKFRKTPDTTSAAEFLFYRSIRYQSLCGIAALKSFMESMKEGLHIDLKGLHHRCFVRKFPNIFGAAYENSNSLFKIFQCRCRCHANVDADAEMPVRRFPAGLFITVKIILNIWSMSWFVTEKRKQLSFIWLSSVDYSYNFVYLWIYVKKVRYVKGFLRANKLSNSSVVY